MSFNISGLPQAVDNISSNISATSPQTIDAAISNITGSAGDLTAGLNSGVSNLGSTVQSLAGGLPGSLSGLTSSVSGMVGGVTDKLSGLLNNIPSDPTALAAKLNIDTNAVSGLSSAFSSKLNTEISGLTSKFPSNADITAISKQGLLLDKMSAADLAKLPIPQPPAVPPQPLTDPNLSKAVAAIKGSVSGLLGGAANLAPLTNTAGITNSIGQLSAGLSAGVGSISGVTGQLSTIQSTVNTAVGNVLDVRNNIGSLSQNSIGSINPASIGLGSVESNLSTINNITQNLPGSPDLSYSVTSILGSRQQTSLASVVQYNSYQGFA